MNIKEGLSFDDVLLVPQNGVLDSRKNAVLYTEIVPGWSIGVPIVAANMPSVVNVELAKEVWRNGGYSFLHRFQSIESEVAEFNYLSSAGCGASIGLDDWERLRELERAGCEIFCVDVAHADCERAIEFCDGLRKSGVARFVVGNVATYEGALRLLHTGANALKVGIGPGAACSTREVTGFGVPQLTAIMEVKRAIDIWKRQFGGDARLIADGGIKNSGDIVKALAAGADTVMVGRLFAGADEAPEPGVYYGSASSHVNSHHAPEGVYAQVQRDGSVESIIKKLTWGIRSGISYAGAKDLKGLRENAQWVKVSSASQIESGVRI